MLTLRNIGVMSMLLIDMFAVMSVERGVVHCLLGTACCLCLLLLLLLLLLLRLLLLRSRVGRSCIVVIRCIGPVRSAGRRGRSRSCGIREVTVARESCEWTHRRYEWVPSSKHFIKRSQFTNLSIYTSSVFTARYTDEITQNLISDFKN